MHLEDMDLSDEPVPLPDPLANIDVFVPRTTTHLSSFPPPEVIGQGADQEAAAQITYRAPHTPAATAQLHDRAAEAHVLSCLLLEPAQAKLLPAAFYFPEHRLLYLSIQRLLAASAPVELATIAADLSDKGQFTTTGGWPFLFGIENRTEIPTTLHFQHYAARITELANRRATQRHAQATLQAIASGQALPKAPQVTQLLATDTTAARRVRFALKPQEPVTRLFLNGKPVCTPANLTTIISRAKTGKTTALGAAVAAILGAHYDHHDLDTFKFSAPHTDEAVILIDTEQSPYDAWTCHHRTLQRAGDPVDPEWLHHYALVGMGARQLRDSLTSILARATTAHKGIFTIILDGVADFVTSVNDEAETNEFVAWLQSLAVLHNTPIICVIHSNEGIKNGDDGRGHLGKQLTRKAESNLLLKKVGEITTITSEKQRKAPITEKDGVAFRWDDEYQRHVTCEPEEEESRPKGGKPKQYHFDHFTGIFPRSADKAMTKQQLLRYAVDIAPIKETSFREILHDATERGELVRTSKHGAFHYHLNVPSGSR